MRRADTGETVRPVPGLEICTDQLITRLAPGETGDALGFGWDGRDTKGQPLPPGTSLLRAALGNGAVGIRPPDLRVKLTP